ncbi:hypothetical protein RB595_000441 [Gaeumannomyces hyphopodioides]
MSTPGSDPGQQLAVVGVPSRPVTPGDIDSAMAASQVTLPSTEPPASPMDLSASFKTELNDDRLEPPSIIPSSLTPPPSSQLPPGPSGLNPPHLLGEFGPPQESSILSPPITGLVGSRRDYTIGGAEYVAPTPSQVIQAPADELRSMMQASIAEHARLKMEAAHFKLQHQLLCIQYDEDAKRAEVEHEMVRREMDALRTAEHSRQARRELSSATESIQAKYLQLRLWYDETVQENEALHKRLKGAKKLIQHKEEEINALTDEKELLLNRLRENREHFHLLCSPGGLFHGAVTPKAQATATTPVQPPRQASRQTPKSAQQQNHHRDGSRAEREHNEAPFAALLQVLNQENNSAPSTPITAHRPAPRITSKHTRNVQSMSSLPTTPAPRAGREYGGLLPSADLVPQTEPPQRYNSRVLIPETPVRSVGRRSRESTISAEDHEEPVDNQELARQALSFAVAAATSHVSHQSSGSRRAEPHPGDQDEEEVFESQASQAASEMLRRDPRESFDVASSAGGSRDPTPAPAEKSARLQARLFAGTSEKRKFSGGHDTSASEMPRSDVVSPTKKLRIAGGLREVGLGIQYGHNA